MRNGIKHEGIVSAVSGNHVTVRIVQSSACAQCHISGRCNAAENKVKQVDVYTAEAATLRKGDSVVVVASSRVGQLAILLCAIIPLLLVIAVLTIVLITTENEVAAALSGIASLIPYYILLYLLRGKIGARVAFDLESY